MKKMNRLAVIVAFGFLLMSVVYPITPTAAQKSVELTPCKLSVGIGKAKSEIDARCGILQVPEDPAKPDGRKLDLHFRVLPATKPDAKGLPIFHLEGGPGGSAISSFGLAWYTAYRLFRENHDVVLIDQRGIGKSASLQCTELTEKSFEGLAKATTDEEDEKEVTAGFAACLKRLAATNDPAFYTSTIMADDTNAVRAALGYDQINIYGNSYGTWLGQIYLRRHGERVRAIILDSPVGPWNQPELVIARNLKATLDKIFELCRADTVCNTTYPDLPGQLQKAVDLLKTKPLTAIAPGILTGKTYTVAFTPTRLLTALRFMMYQGSAISLVPQAISTAAQGNLFLAATVLVAANEQIGDVSLGLNYSVVCSELAPFYTEDQIKQYADDNFYGAFQNMVENTRNICKVWRSAELDPADVAPVKSNRPVLILSGALDPATPPSFAEETNRRLANSKLVTFPYQAHAPLAASKCAQVIAAAFLNDPEKPLDTSCTANDVKPVFMGAYKVDLTPFTDPQGKFQANVPRGWTVQAQQSNGPMTFLASPDGAQLLGIGVFKDMDGAKAQKAAFELIAKTYGPVEVQVTESMLFITVVQHTLDRPTEANTGMLMVRALGKDTMVVWQAGPNNIFQATALAIAPQVFASVIAK
jgi:pimeloyl-ACP methyl ester carboxylesterase